MAQVTIPIGGANYVVGCHDGEEEHLRHLSQKIEKNLTRVRAELSPAGEGHALFLTALLLADEIYDLQHGKMSKDTSHLLKQAKEITSEQERYRTRLLQVADLAENLLKRVDRDTK